MAKSARASDVKKNHRKLRAKVFGPAYDARTARLSAKLQELAAKPKPETEKPMEVDNQNEEGTEEHSGNVESEDMDIDALGATMKPAKSKSGAHKASARVHKVSKRKKPRNSMVFASEVARRKKAVAAKKNKT